jgi:hypothetical protein
MTVLQTVEEAEEARLLAERRMKPDHLSIVVQNRHVMGKTGVAEQQHLEDIVLLPGFTVDDARKLKGGEGAQFRTDAVKMVELETQRVAQLHEIVGTDDVWLSLDGVIMDPADFTALDAALAAAQEQIVAGQDEGDSDVKEIALVSAALMETARYQAMSGAEQLPPPPEGGEGGVLASDPPPGQTYFPPQA